MGDGWFVDIEWEVDFGGFFYLKGVLILFGFLVFWYV